MPTTTTQPTTTTKMTPTARLILHYLSGSTTPSSIQTIASATAASTRTVALLANRLTHQGILRRSLDYHTAVFQLANLASAD